VTALGAYVVGLLIIFAFGLVGLKLAAPSLVEAGFMVNASWSTVIEDGFTFFIGWEVLKAVVAALLLPAAWKIADSRRDRSN
jgi:biotin transport system substrate-specific component